MPLICVLSPYSTLELRPREELQILSFFAFSNEKLYTFASTRLSPHRSRYVFIYDTCFMMCYTDKTHRKQKSAVSSGCDSHSHIAFWSSAYEIDKNENKNKKEIIMILLVIPALSVF